MVCCERSGSVVAADVPSPSRVFSENNHFGNTIIEADYKHFATYCSYGLVCLIPYYVWNRTLFSPGVCVYSYNCELAKVSCYFVRCLPAHEMCNKPRPYRFTLNISWSVLSPNIKWRAAKHALYIPFFSINHLLSRLFTFRYKLCIPCMFL
jgi:hypothetical protein